MFPLRVDVLPFVVGGLQCLSAVTAFVVVGCLACRRVPEEAVTYNRSCPAAPHRTDKHFVGHRIDRGVIPNFQARFHNVVHGASTRKAAGPLHNARRGQE